MRIKIEFDMDNDIFGFAPISETKRIVSEIALKIENGETEETIKDLYGNTIGNWEIIMQP